MQLTKQQAIEEHRKMWNWIADETLKRKYKVQKYEYFEEHENEYGDICIFNHCWCCMYAKNFSLYLIKCINCPIKWGKYDCTYSDSPYYAWLESSSYEEAAYYARKIAELPEKEDD